MPAEGSGVSSGVLLNLGFLLDSEVAAVPPPPQKKKVKKRMLGTSAVFVYRRITWPL